MRIIAVASHLFAPTHHSLAHLAEKLQSRVDLTLFAKHPEAYPAPAVPVPSQLPYLTGVWKPSAHAVHCIGGGETAINVANWLDRQISLIVSFTGAVDLTRQLNNPALAAGYGRLFERAAVITCPNRDDAAWLEGRGAPRDRIEVTLPVLPVAGYPSRDTGARRRAIFVARDLPRKNAALAHRVAQRASLLEEFLAAGVELGQAAGQPTLSLGRIPHLDLVACMRGCRVLLVTSDWTGDEVDAMPIIILEALAMGLMVVSTPIRGALQLQTRFPLRVRIGTDDQSLAAQLDEALLQDDKGMAEAQQWVQAQFSPGSMVERVVDLYSRVAGGA
ncbi:MAG: glycosyltransferase [Acidobacteriota bacterium]|nr:glycosyltransferase [Acidobacteriota bacterium]